MNWRLAAGRTIEVVAVGLLIAGTAWLGSLVRHNWVEHGTDTRPGGRVAAPAQLPAADAAGQTSPVELTDRVQPLLLLVLSTQCPFCAENMPQWQDLVAAWREAVPEGEVLALSIGTAEQTRAYLQQHRLDVSFRTVDAAVLPLLGAAGYPTTSVFLPQDRTLVSWPGVIGVGEHEAVLALVARAPAPLAVGGM